jgi:glyoxylase-like metal-dependent hydrolase (beta-lactamase superfamily II)
MPVTRDNRAPVVQIEDLGNDLFAIDSRMAGYEKITAAYLLRTERPCLVETGPAKSVPTVAAALEALGLDRGELATIVVTHIHLDHAGGVGDLAAEFPNAEVVVHERGARHLADPSRLLDSARRVFGPMMDTVFGELRPTDAPRIRSVGDLGSIELGSGRRLETLYTPGHAQHHICLLDSATGDVYTGDAAGVYIPQIDLVRATTPPPDFNLPNALASIDRLLDLAPTRLLFSHYGPVTDVTEVLGRTKKDLQLWVEDVQKIRMADAETDHAIAMIRARTAQRYASLYADPVLNDRYEKLASIEANINGIARYLNGVYGTGLGSPKDQAHHSPGSPGSGPGGLY